MTATALKFDGKYVEMSEIIAAGGVWSDELSAYIFADGSAGRFTDIRNGAQEQARTGEPILHFIGWIPAKD